MSDSDAHLFYGAPIDGYPRAKIDYVDGVWDVDDLWAYRKFGETSYYDLEDHQKRQKRAIVRKYGYADIDETAYVALEDEHHLCYYGDIKRVPDNLEGRVVEDDDEDIREFARFLDLTLTGEVGWYFTSLLSH